MVLEAGCVGRCGLNAVVWEKDANPSTSAKSVSLIVSSTPVRAWPSDQFEGADGHAASAGMSTTGAGLVAKLIWQLTSLKVPQDGDCRRAATINPG